MPPRSAGTLYLIPVALGADAAVPPGTATAVAALRHFVVENAKSARRFLKAAGYPSVGLMSEAGCPAVADPGAALVRLAHERGIRVVPLVGPSAVLLALMASGLNGQRFSFHGYLPVDKTERRRRIEDLERESALKDATQIFIETPYRNHALLSALFETCHDDTLLCLATDLTLPRETVRTQTIRGWKKDPPEIHRRPTVFLLHREPRQRITVLP
ncbi:MAG: SAM-dependent methyltransferase [Betaproteobacteria bacterium]|nr:SAM-dependent methyltransferase [Betaproteobacteria bacterium]